MSGSGRRQQKNRWPRLRVPFLRTADSAGRLTAEDEDTPALEFVRKLHREFGEDRLVVRPVGATGPVGIYVQLALASGSLCVIIACVRLHRPDRIDEIISAMSDSVQEAREASGEKAVRQCAAAILCILPDGAVVPQEYSRERNPTRRTGTERNAVDVLSATMLQSEFEQSSGKDLLHLLLRSPG